MAWLTLSTTICRVSSTRSNHAVSYMDKPQCTLIVGPSGCVKIHTLLHEILEKNPKYDILILCPTFFINKTYSNWACLESDPDVIGLEVSSDNLNTLLKHIIETFSGCKTAVVIDNMSVVDNQMLETLLMKLRN